MRALTLRNFLSLFLILFLVFAALTPVFAEGPPPSPGDPPGGGTGGGGGGGTGGGGTGGGGTGGTTPGCTATTCFQNPLAAPTLGAFLDLALNALILILFPFVILFFIYGAFTLVKAQGVPGEIAKGKKALLWTTVGALIILGARAITIAIQGTVEEIQSTVVQAEPPAHAEIFIDYVA